MIRPKRSIHVLFFFLWRCDPTRVMASSFTRFSRSHTTTHPVGRTPLDEWSARRRDLYLTTDKYPCPRWDSNPRSQQASGHWDRQYTRTDKRLLTHWGRGHLNCLNARYRVFINFNPLNAELNPICYLLALLPYHFLHVSRIRVKSLTFRLLMSYIYIYIYIWSAYSWCF